MVTLHEDAVDDVFSIANGLANSIDIRYLAPFEFVAPNLLDVSNNARYNALAAATFSLSSSTIRMFFVDAINWCGSGGTYAGCAGGSTIVLDSNEAAHASRGDELIAHEIGHILGLSHVSGDNLMNGSVADGRDTLTDAQITTIFGSSKVQGDSLSGFFIDIAPILVVAAATVPVPSALVLILGGLFPLALRRRVRQAA
jgi:hypothetical protein